MMTATSDPPFPTNSPAGIVVSDACSASVRLSKAERQAICNAIRSGIENQESLIRCHHDEYTGRPILESKPHIKEWEREIREWERLIKKILQNTSEQVGR